MWGCGFWEHRFMGDLVLLDFMVLEVFSNWNNFVMAAQCTTSYTLIFLFPCVVWLVFWGSLVRFLDFSGCFGHGETWRL